MDDTIDADIFILTRFTGSDFFIYAWPMFGVRPMFGLAGLGNVCYVVFGYGSGLESAGIFVLVT